MLSTNDNRSITAGKSLLTLAAVASLWCQVATTSIVQAANSKLPEAFTGQPAQANIQSENSAPTPPQMIMPPLLPGQTGANYEAAMKMGEQAYLNKSYAPAVDNFQAAIHFKSTPDAHLGLGLALEQSGLTEPALVQFFEALKLNSTYAPARSALGNTLMKKESWDEAAGQFLQVLQVNPGDLAARGNLGICYEQKGQIDPALEQFKYIATVSPKYLDGHYNLAVAYELKSDWDKAIEEYLKVIQINPRHSMALVQLSHCYMNKGDYRRAEQLLKVIMRMDPKNYQAAITYGRIFELQKKDKEATEWYRKAILIAPKAPECERLEKNLMRKRSIELGLPILPGLQ
jgi:tetratricopeptide (TPR) repeat protein